MMKSLLPLLLLSFLLDGTQQQNLDSCPSGVEPLIAGQRYRVHEQFFSSDLSNETAHESRLDGDSWCSSPPSNSEHWLQITFGTNVTIHTLQTAGHDRFLFLDDYYVTSFQVYVGSSSSNLQPITAENSSMPMVFLRTETYDTEDTVLPSPITTQVLRIVILTWSPMDDEICFNVEALGCLTEPICEDSPRLSADRDILDFINASSSMSDDPPVDALDNGRSAWCSSEAFMEGPAPYLLVHFSSDVALTHMEARGGVLGFSYVTGFRLEVQEEEESGNFTAYGVTDEPTIFTTDTSDLVLYTFWRPVQGETFRFNILSGNRNILRGDFCWNIRIYGCFSNGTAPDIPPPLEPATTESPPTSFTDQRMQSTGTTESTGTTTGSTRELNRLIVGGSVIGVCLIGVLILIIVVIVCAAVYFRSRPVEDNEPASNDTLEETIPTYHKFDNAIYGEDELKNPSPISIDEADQAAPSVPNNTYESLPSSLPGHHSLHSPQEPQYDYADSTVVRARVNKVPKEADQELQVLVKTGFDVCEDEGKEGEDNMETNLAYGYSPSPAEDSTAQKGAPEAAAALTESMANNPMYGSN